MAEPEFNLSDVKSWSDDQVKHLLRWAELLKDDRDLEIVVLRGHMLIERQLNLILATRLRTPLDDLLKIRRNFETTCKLAFLGDALLGKSYVELQETPLNLNGIRNRMAHRLDYKTLEADVMAFTMEHERKHAERFKDCPPEAQERLKVLLCHLAAETGALMTEWVDRDIRAGMHQLMEMTAALKQDQADDEED